MRMIARFGRPWLIAGAVLLAPAGHAVAQDTFVDPASRFSIDVPSTYVLASAAAGSVFQFQAGLYAKNGGPRIILLFQPSRDLNAGFQQAIKLMGNSLPNAAPVGPVQDLTLNGHSARMALYGGQVRAKGSGQLVRIFALIGSSVMKRGSAVYLTFMNAGQRTEWEDDLRDVFLSLREEGAPISGARNVHPHKP